MRCRSPVGQGTVFCPGTGLRTVPCPMCSRLPCRPASADAVPISFKFILLFCFSYGKTKIPPRSGRRSAALSSPAPLCGPRRKLHPFRQFLSAHRRRPPSIGTAYRHTQSVGSDPRIAPPLTLGLSHGGGEGYSPGTFSRSNCRFGATVGLFFYHLLKKTNNRCKI